ncbi:protocatechuate 3,4-dioxygenase subunit alpha [Faunimonas sp. B44]|uniref:protocatechuate 3,4-dioxygenase subunit alpha n=1 Tax=Faunimonas sp. B44 TaxID=3461493 RepID=UPI004044715A
MTLKQTPSQTVGPYFAYGLTAEQYGYPHDALAGGKVADELCTGERIHVTGRVFDGEGVAIDDVMIEIWQADSEGRYLHPEDGRASNSVFTGFGRYGTGTDPQNRYLFETVKPGSVDGVQAPHINVILFMRGQLSHLYTRIYFSDEEEANGRDPVLQSVPEERRRTLVASREDMPIGTVYRFDIHMQGADETVFFDV